MNVWPILAVPALLLVQSHRAVEAQAPSSLIVDVDGSETDFLALAALLATDVEKSTEVRLITVNGNTRASLYAAFKNTRRFLSLMKRDDIPVALGAGISWLNQAPAARLDKNVSATGSASSLLSHCKNLPLPQWFPDSEGVPWPPTSPKDIGLGLYPFNNQYDWDTCYGMAGLLPLSAAEDTEAEDLVNSLLLGTSYKPPSAVTAAFDLFRRESRPVQYLALGSLTNLANLLKQAEMNHLDALASTRIGTVYIAGGNLQPASTPAVLPFPEWNTYVDPPAADYVMQHNGISRVMFTTDLTNQVRFDGDRWMRLTKFARNQRAQIEVIHSVSSGAEWLSAVLFNLEKAIIRVLQPVKTKQNSGAMSEMTAQDADFLNMLVAPHELFVAVAVSSTSVKATLEESPRSHQLRCDQSTGSLLDLSSSSNAHVNASVHLAETTVYQNLNRNFDGGRHQLFWLKAFEWLNM